MSEKYDLSAIFDEHVADEFVAKDVAATMSTMTAEPFVNHVPTMMGGVGGRGSFMTPAIATLLGRWFWWPMNVRSRPPRPRPAPAEVNVG